jgi:DNA repair protein RadC
LPEAEDGFDFGGEPPARSDAGKSAGDGHRARLRERLLTGGAEALADYEVLEYLLFAAIPRGDTKPLAKALIAQFGSLAGVLNADPKALQRVKGVGEASAAAIKSVAIAARRMTRGEIVKKPVLGSWQALIDYLTTDMAHLTVERVRVLYLDTKNRLIDDHHVGDGSIDEAAIHPREDPRTQPPFRLARTQPRRYPDHPTDCRGRAVARRHRPRSRHHRARGAHQPARQGAYLARLAIRAPPA